MTSAAPTTSALVVATTTAVLEQHGSRTSAGVTTRTGSLEPSFIRPIAPVNASMALVVETTTDAPPIAAGTAARAAAATTAVFWPHGTASTATASTRTWWTERSSTRPIAPALAGMAREEETTTRVRRTAVKAATNWVDAPQRRQYSGSSSTRMVKISSRPTSIITTRIHFPASGT